MWNVVGAMPTAVTSGIGEIWISHRLSYRMPIRRLGVRVHLGDRDPAILPCLFETPATFGYPGESLSPALHVAKDAGYFIVEAFSIGNRLT